MSISPTLQYRLWLAALILGIPLAVFFAFGHALAQGWAPIDDILLVTGNLAAHGLTLEHLRLAFTTYDPELYIPLTLVSFQIDYSIAGLTPLIFHVTNLILHSLNAILVVLILKKLTGSRWGSLLGGLLFAVHPLHTEAVVWVTGRKDLLFAFFALLSILFWIDREKHKGFTVISIVSLLLALLSKVSAVLVFPLWIAIDWYRGKLPKNLFNVLNPSNLLNLWPYLISLLLCLVFGIVSFGGKERVLGSQPILEVVLTGFRSIWFYISQFFLPTSLAISHEWIGAFTMLNAELIGGALLTIGAIGLAWKLRERAPWFAFGVAFFLLAVLPTFLGSRKGGTLLFAVERYAYIPSIGIAFLLIMLGRTIVERLNTKAVLAGLSGLAIAIAVLIARVQTRTWDTPEALFQHSLQVTPASIGSRVSLAEVMLQGGDIEGSFAVLKEGLRYGKDRLLSLAAANAYAKAGDTAAAREQFSSVLLTIPTDPDALFGVASLDEQAGNTDAALANYRKAVAADPSFVAARNGIARISLTKNDIATAEDQLTLALKWNPSAGESHRLMGHIRLDQNNYKEAEEHFLKALDLNGESAEVLLGLAKAELGLGKKEEAEKNIERVLQAEPKNAEARALISHF